MCKCTELRSIFGTIIYNACKQKYMYWLEHKNRWFNLYRAKKLDWSSALYNSLNRYCAIIMHEQLFDLKPSTWLSATEARWSDNMYGFHKLMHTDVLQIDGNSQLDCMFVFYIIRLAKRHVEFLTKYPYTSKTKTYPVRLWCILQHIYVYRRVLQRYINHQ